MPQRPSPPRLHGLDLARFLAYVGMVIVNFSVIMQAEQAGGVVGTLITSLQGRAAATFVVLAGVGLGLSLAPARISSNDARLKSIWLTSKRALFLLIIGLINMLVFSADILHYYAFYFFFGVLLAAYSSRVLIAVIIALNVLSVGLVLNLDFEKGWDFTTLEYAGFWTPEGFIRNLFFNGWHPVIPWLGLLLYGLVISRLPLAQITTQKRLVLWGSVIFIATELVSKLLQQLMAAEDLQTLVATDAIPAMPLYSLAGMSIASVVIGLCLMLGNKFAQHKWFEVLSAAGKQTLTLYLAHILIGMVVLDSIGLLAAPQTPLMALSAALLFSVIMLLYANVWQAYFKRGPLEALMRKLTG